jgi:uncharacterized NAD(P)/FAD-binding protein YdhS
LRFGQESEIDIPRRIRHVAIIGAGFSGSLQAINLLRHDGPRATLIERSHAFGRGVAYSTAHPDHLLNVRAANMSALPDDPDHFARWLKEHHDKERGSFAQRTAYGDYLAELLEEATRRAPDRLARRQERAVEVSFGADGAQVMLDSGEKIHADAVIIAIGNLTPHDPPGLTRLDLPPDLYVQDPWAADISADLQDSDEVLIVGTGLTMIDTALLLEARGFGGRITALSRRGLLPHAHGASPIPHAPIAEWPRTTGSALLRQMRARAAEIGWREAVDEIRPFTQAMWLGASREEQARFLRHLRPWWDIHRHRLAPEIAGRIAALRDSGRLKIVGGRLRKATAAGDGVDTIWSARGSGTRHHARFRRIINCTGPQGDLLRTREPLLHLLLAGGHIRPDAHRLGIDVTPQAEAIDARGVPNPRLLVLGPMTRGAFWEIVAVPDIRQQTWAVARRLSQAHWVGGEGL